MVDIVLSFCSGLLKWPVYHMVLVFVGVYPVLGAQGGGGGAQGEGGYGVRGRGCEILMCGLGRLW